MSKMKPKLNARQAAYKIYSIAKENRLDMIGIMFDQLSGEGGMVNHIPNPENVAMAFVRFISAFEQEMMNRFGMSDEEAKGYILKMVNLAVSDEAQQKTKVEHVVDPTGPESILPLAE